MFGFGRKNAERRNFWSWLADNAKRIQSGLEHDVQRTADEIGERFKKAYPDLVYEVCVNREEPWTFCVSANGDPDLFAGVKQAVAEAPAMEGWKIAAFRPRGTLDAEIQMDGQKLSCDDIWCEVQMIEGRANIVLHIRGATVETEETLTHASMILLDNAVGEFNAATRIIVRDVALLEKPPTATGSFFPLSDLPAFLDRHQ